MFPQTPNITEMFGVDRVSGSYRFVNDTHNCRIRLLKKKDNELTPLAVWRYEKLAAELSAHEN